VLVVQVSPSGFDETMLCVIISSNTFLPRFCASHPAMNLLCRMLTVLSLVLLCMQGAFAHEHVRRAMDVSHELTTVGAEAESHAVPQAHSHCSGMATTGKPYRHDPICCAVACGLHCGALFIAFHFEPRIPDASTPQPFAEARRDGVTHAPLLRPPIA
jgi:hypothetical protein